MEKRTILALVLVAAVLVLTPRLFPGKGASALVERPDSTATSLTAVPSTSAPMVAESLPSAREPAHSAGSIQPTQLAQAETTSVSGSSAIFRFTSHGATLESVQLTGFKDLQAKNRGPVNIMAPQEPLLNLRLVAGRDTVALGGVPFSLSRTTAGPGNEELTYRGSIRGATVVLMYSVKADSFLVNVRGMIGSSDSLPESKYVIVDLPRSFRSAEADTIDDQHHFAYAYKPKIDNAKSIPFGKLDPGERQLIPGPLTWVVAKSKYFLVGLLSDEKNPIFAEMSATGGARTSKVVTEAIGSVVATTTNGAFAFEIYAGPQQWRRLQTFGRDFENSNPYGGFLQPVIQPIATIVMKILLWMRENLKISYGWVLIIFGIVVRVALWPLNQKGMRASMKMQRIQPELNEIQKRYKSDPQKLQSEMMRVYKEHNMSPFSTFSGCLPLFLPLPILFALFYVFGNTIEFRGVSFLWFPDISQKDPYYIIALLMGISMFFLSWIGMRGAPPNPQTKMMGYVMPVMMTFLFANFAAGLNLYYTIQNLAALPQQWFIANERARNASTGTGKG